MLMCATFTGSPIFLALYQTLLSLVNNYTQGKNVFVFSDLFTQLYKDFVCENWKMFRFHVI